MIRKGLREGIMDRIESKLSALEDIKLRALYIEKRFMSNDPEATTLAESELMVLQDRFCNENSDFITPLMARAIKKDFNTFLVLIDWARDYYKKAGE
jgi:hypothetical protein